MSYRLQWKKDLCLNLPVPGKQQEVVLLSLGEKHTTCDFVCVGWNLPMPGSGRVSLVATGASQLPESSPCLSKMFLSSGTLKVRQ